MTTAVEFSTREAKAYGRQAGKLHLHTVTDWYGEVVAERRSEHRYAYAICKRIPPHNEGGRARLVVTRWSKLAKSATSEFALTVAWEADW